MIKTKYTWSITIILAISMLVHILSLVASKTFLLGVVVSHEPLHAIIEILGSTVALVVAWFLLSQEDANGGTSFNVWIASALIAMGVLDAFHAVVHVGHTFVWLHSTATFIGALFFCCTLLPSSWQKGMRVFWPSFSLVASIFFGSLFLIFPKIIPAMIDSTGHFTPMAKFLNIAGGVLLLVVAVRLVYSFYKTKNQDDFLFCLHCVLFGSAAVMFESSRLWDVAWWGWHILRLAAYAVALYFVLKEQWAIKSKTDRVSTQKQLALEAAHMSTFFCDLTDSQIECDKGIYNIFNFLNHTPPRFKEIVARLDAEGQTKIMEAAEQGKKELGKYSGQVKLDKKYADHRTLSYILSFVGGSKGADGLHGIFWDVTEENKKIEETKKLNKRLELSLQASSIGVWDWDIQKNLLVWEKEMLDLYGVREYHPDQGFTIWERFLHPDDKERVLSEIKLAVSGEKKLETDFRIILDDGNVRHLKALADTIHDQITGKAKRLTGVNWDITEQKTMIQQLKDQKIELKKSNIELEQFAFAASHDLQEPLRKIISYSGVLEEKINALSVKDDDTQFVLDVITKSSTRMQKLIHDLLTYSRVGRKNWTPEKLCLNEVVEAALDNLEITIEDHSAEVSVDALPEILGDKNHMIMLFQNIIGNAVKYRDKDKKPSVSVQAKKLNEKWEFAIKDNGIGIKKEHTDQIFVLFNRLHGRGKYEGNGIGLAMCKKTVEKLGGEIWAESNVGNGSTFKFTLPVDENEINNCMNS